MKRAGRKPTKLTQPGKGHHRVDEEGFLVDPDDILAWLTNLTNTSTTGNVRCSPSLFEIDGVHVQVKGDLRLRPAIDLVLFQGHLPVRFESVIGGLDISLLGLTSLAGSPRTVTGSMYLGYNALTNLFGSPRTIGGDFFCFHSTLRSFTGAPDQVGGDFRGHVNPVDVVHDDDVPDVAGRLLLPTQSQFLDWSRMGVPMSHPSMSGEDSFFIEVRGSDLRAARQRTHLRSADHCSSFPASRLF